MADTVNVRVLRDGSAAYAVQLQCRSDGTGESAVVKVDKSALLLNGAEPGSLAIEEVQFAIGGFSSVVLEWAHTVPDLALVLTGVGRLDYLDLGGINDPKSAGGTGDLILTSVGAAIGATYEILLFLRKAA